MCYPCVLHVLLRNGRDMLYNVFQYDCEKDTNECRQKPTLPEVVKQLALMKSILEKEYTDHLAISNYFQMRFRWHYP